MYRGIYDAMNKLIATKQTIISCCEAALKCIYRCSSVDMAGN